MTTRTSKEKTVKSKVLENLIAITAFIVITSLITTLIMISHTLFFEYNPKSCYNPQLSITPALYNSSCHYNASLIQKCHNKSGVVVYLTNCSIFCNTCFHENQKLRKNFENKKFLYRITLSVVLLIILMILLKLKTIKQPDVIEYSIITGSFLSILFSTFSAMEFLEKKFLTVSILIELIIVIFFYKSMHIIIKGNKN